MAGSWNAWRRNLNQKKIPPICNFAGRRSVSSNVSSDEWFTGTETIHAYFGLGALPIYRD